MIIRLLQHFASSSTCTPSGGSFFGIPKWYAYLPGRLDPVSNVCNPQFTSISDFWLIVAAVIEMLLRLGAIVAVFMVIYGGVTFATSQGNPEDTKKARNTIIYALVGLLVSITASFIITFVAKSIMTRSVTA